MRKHKSALLVGFSVVTILCVGLVVSIYLSSLNYVNPPSISLPNTGSIDVGDDIKMENNRVVTDIKVDTKNVTAVLLKLKRPSEYSFLSKTRVYSGERSTETSARGYVSGTRGKFTQYEGEQAVSEVLILPETTYTWRYGSTAAFYTSKTGTFSYDDGSFLPTYEELLSSEDILQATLLNIDDTLCLEVVSQDSDTGLHGRYTIEIDNGLLKKVEFYLGEVLVMACEVTEVSVEPVPQTIFTLPNGLQP